MTWHRSYTERVLEPDYRFAERHLLPHLLDALTAHVRTVADLEVAAGEPARHEITLLDEALLRLRGRSLPEFAPDVPDAYFAILRTLDAELGPAPVGWLRLGLSRNDLDMTIYKLRAREQTLRLAACLWTLRGVVLEQAEREMDTVLIAQTHHQPGQPTTVGHYLLAIAGLLERDGARLLAAFARTDRCPLGAAALAGSSHLLDREASARRLGFAGPVTNTYDAVASSDWEVELVAVSQSIALNGSRFVCDLLGWTSAGAFRLPDALVQGSSIMPQKRNPVSLEHARTRFSRAVGAAQMVLYSSHNIPFADLNDFGPDVQGALQTQHLQLVGGLELLVACAGEGRFDRETLASAAAATDTTATELADELVRSAGLDFGAAHAVVGRLVSTARAAGRPLASCGPDDVVAAGGPALEAAVVREALDATAFVARRRGLGGPAREALIPQLARATDVLAEDRRAVVEIETRLETAQRHLRAPRKETA